MRLFQNCGLGHGYQRVFAAEAAGIRTFGARLVRFYEDRYGASHILKPVYDGAATAFFTNGDDEVLQAAWARENGLPAAATPADILLAQIEQHRTEVFYNLDPTRFDASFVRRLPASVKAKVAWRAAPGKIDFAGYDRVVSNFPSIRAGYAGQGVRTAELHPAHDPELDIYAANRQRDLDVVFCGGFTRHHLRRRAILETVAALGSELKVAFFLDGSRYQTLANTPLGYFPPFSAMRQPPVIRKVAAAAVFGRRMYAAIGRAKVVLNAAVDMAGTDRGNMRCFEAMGAGAALLTDTGSYPAGMEVGSTMVLYENPQDVVATIRRTLAEGIWDQMGVRANQMVRERYSKDAQWREFEGMVAAI